MRQPDTRTRRNVTNLLRWYRTEARALPWRIDPNPYRVWISEIMLQQTTVTTAAPYYTRFIEAYPTVEDLAAADEQTVLGLWSGLGYYHRARNLLKTARIIVERHGGLIPSDRTTLLSLPGIGQYTSAAIMSIGYGAPAVALDANILRVVARLEAITGEPRRAATRRLIEEAAQRMIPELHASAFNQALMDLGSAFCSARDPVCAGCPVKTGCLARIRGLVDSIPPRITRATTMNVELAAIAIRRGGEYMLMPRAGDRLMSGMWEFPMVAGGERTALDGAARSYGARLVAPVGTVRHTITNHRIRITVYEARTARATSRASRSTRHAVGEPGAHLATRSEAGTGLWVPLPAIASGHAGVALTGAARKIARMMSRASQTA